MNRELLRPGTIVRYPYLWKWQDARGETEGRKDRPTCVLVAARRPGPDVTHLALLAISSQPPTDGEVALEVPEIECRRGGLADWRQAWITVGEYNYDIAERSYYLELDQRPLGRFGKPFVMRVAAAFLPVFADRQARVDRTE